MKRYFLLAIAFLFISELFSQGTLRTKNRYYDIDIDTTINGIWAGADEVSTDVADSIYLFFTGLPDNGDLQAPDLELKMKSLWYGTKVFFLFRHLDDELVNGYIDGIADTEVKDGLQNRDATALYFFLDTSDVRLDQTDDIYPNSSYIDSIAWFRWVWGTDDFEGELKGDTISDISVLGGEIKQWKDDRYSYAKLSVDITKMAAWYDSLEYLRFGFDIELDENDKEVKKNDTYGIQTRAFYGSDMDSSALASRNVSNWQWLFFTYGDTCKVCEQTLFVSNTTTDFASVYPNPAREQISLKLESFGLVNYKLFDLTGRLIIVGSDYGSEIIIPLNSVQEGSYYLQLQNSEGKQMTHKILILK
jgi:hypothetical protein